ncbi:nucleoside 2-deoxyribosyltransferase [Lactobacillus psittaci]|uniref:2-deoxyribosyltransferase n=1 Tax=Lactobacillus psittaci DSM 15354 TaxID=1122152 RepID=A0A0R1S3Z2_9LACO|nr:nucleoside 2-deoxyribosyltransferase [Lactobacillus psittaci]KRL63246.1 2-deoxyribosyltransferase [Lactobacillus psittaci DSM 15354]
MTRTRTLYFGAGWFNEKQTKAYDAAMDALKANPTVDLDHSYVPLQNQYKGIRVDEHPEYLRDKEWASATYTNDLIGIKTSDIMLGVYLPEEEDVGLGMELGYAMGQGKYILLVVPDEDYGKPINLMSWGVADNVIKISELKDFDFNKPRFSFYEGAVY